MSTSDPDLPPEPPDARGRRGGEREDGDLDVEAAFAEIVSRWDAAGPPVGSWPVQEDVYAPVADTGTPDAHPPDAHPPDAHPHNAHPHDAHPHDAGADAARQSQPRTPSPAVPVVTTTPAPAPAAASTGTRAAHSPSDPPADDDERWSPPELPPMARAGWRSVLPWVGVLGSPAFFLVVVLANLHLPGVALVAGVVVFMAGFVTLVLRLPARRDDDSDGAVL